MAIKGDSDGEIPHTDFWNWVVQIIIPRAYFLHLIIREPDSGSLCDVQILQMQEVEVQGKKVYDTAGDEIHDSQVHTLST